MTDCKMGCLQALCAHAKSHMQMQPQDAIKFVYQATFGGGHMIENAQESLRFLQEERVSMEMALLLPTSRAEIFEPMGEFARLHIAAVPQNRMVLVNRLFVLSAQKALPSLAEKSALFAQRLDEVQALSQEGVFGFSAQEFADFCKDYRARGCPAEHHSVQYRAAYAPAYRVVSADFAPLWELLCAVDDLLASQDHVTLALDGCAAAGKTTAAALIASCFGGRVIHMDDFFVPFEMRTEQRNAQVGGNVDYERFTREVYPFLGACKDITYGAFDCTVGAVTRQISLPSVLLTVVEGAYCMRPEWRDGYDIAAFCSVPRAEQKRRILARNGQEMWARFESDWILREQAYFDAFSVEKACDFSLSLL